MNKNLLAIGITILFLGLAIQPSIATVQPEKIDVEYVEFTTETYGLLGKKSHTMHLTREQADETMALFNNLKTQVNTINTKIECEAIFNEAILKLYKYGLLGDMSIKEAKKIIIGSMPYNIGFWWVFTYITIRHSTIDANMLVLLALLMEAKGNWDLANFFLEHSQKKLLRALNYILIENELGDENFSVHYFSLQGHKKFLVKENQVVALYPFRGIAIKESHGLGDWQTFSIYIGRTFFADEPSYT